jgi:hypothetical protein
MPFATRGEIGREETRLENWNGTGAGGGEKQNQDRTMMVCAPDTQERLKQAQTKSKREQGFTQTGELLRTSESKEEK